MEVTTTQPTVYGYIRVSTDTQEHSPSAQREAIKTYYEAGGLSKTCTFGGFFEDVSSAGIDLVERRAGLEMCSRLRKGDTVLVTNIDRAFRRVSNMAVQIQRWQDAGINFIAIKQGIDISGMVGRFLANILGAVAELEREMIRDRIREVKANLKKSGLRYGTPPFGYKNSGRFYILDPEKIEECKQVVRWQDVDNRSAKEIAVLLTNYRREKKRLPPVRSIVEKGCYGPDETRRYIKKARALLLDLAAKQQSATTVD